MGITIAWDNEDHSRILQECEDPWNWQDFREAALQVIAMVKSVEHRVDVIFNLLKTKPLQSSAADEARRVMGLWPANIGNVAVVSRQPLVEVMVSMFARHYVEEREVFVSPTLEEARAALAELRES